MNIYPHLVSLYVEWREASTNTDSSRTTKRRNIQEEDRLKVKLRRKQ